LSRASSSAVVKGRRERRFDFVTWGSGMPRDSRVERDCVDKAGVLFPDEGDVYCALILPSSVSGVDARVLGVEELRDFSAGLPDPEVESEPPELARTS